MACRAFGVSETCYCYGPKPKAANEEIADLLTDARKTWGVWAVFSASSLCLRASLEP